ncbi:unnamed protein product [Moneuplotes crassus]|uniref:Uncharacterized protein n=1 Tax=Euplotes crassus TaxID=5936 RepID=A0AAD2D5G6_EUPCR|nr:unnamed protein product [Moneuplotes crassus]
MVIDSKTDCVYDKPGQDPIITKASTSKYLSNFQLFMELEMEYNKEYLKKPIFKTSLDKDALNGKLDLIDFQTSVMKWAPQPIKKKSNKGRKRTPVHNAFSIYELIYDSVLPKWKKCLTLKANRRTAKTLKARSDTVWKKILRDVREFYRLLFRARFHYLEYQSQQGAVACIQTLFSELNIPLKDDEEYIHGVFRYLHQSHKSRFPGLSDKAIPLDAIEKYNEHFRSLYMKDDFGARLLYFVFKNFTYEYCLLVKPRYRQEITEKVCMLLNCYRRMSEPAHLERIEYHLF